MYFLLFSHNPSTHKGNRMENDATEFAEHVAKNLPPYNDISKFIFNLRDYTMYFRLAFTLAN